MLAILLRTYRDGNVIRKRIRIIHGPNRNGLIAFQVLRPDGADAPYQTGTCRIVDIEHGKILWASWPNNHIRGKQLCQKN